MQFEANFEFCHEVQAKISARPSAHHTGSPSNDSNTNLVLLNLFILMIGSEYLFVCLSFDKNIKGPNEPLVA